MWSYEIGVLTEKISINKISSMYSTWTLSSDIFDKPDEIPYAVAVSFWRLYIYYIQLSG